MEDEHGLMNSNYPFGGFYLPTILSKTNKCFVVLLLKNTLHRWLFNTT